MFKRLFFLPSLILCLGAAAAPAQAMRVISLLPSNTEILESLGAGGEVVGVTRYDKFVQHPGVENIGDFMQPNIEKIVSLHPDLIVAGLWTSSHIVPRLKTMGYPVLEIRNEESLEGVYASIRKLAQAVGRSSAAEPVIDDMKRRLKKVRERAHALPRRLRTYIEIDRPYWTVGGNDFLPEAFTAAGADNLFSDLKRQAAQVSPEMIIQRDPDLIISFQAKASEVAGRPGWNTIKAVRSGYIIDDIFQDDLSRPSPRLVSGIEALIERIETLEKR